MRQARWTQDKFLIELTDADPNFSDLASVPNRNGRRELAVSLFKCLCSSFDLWFQTSDATHKTLWMGNA